MVINKPKIWNKSWWKSAIILLANFTILIFFHKLFHLHLYWCFTTKLYNSQLTLALSTLLLQQQPSLTRSLYFCTSVLVPSSPDYWSVRSGRLLLLFAVSLSTLNQNNMIIINVKSHRPRRLGRTLSSERNQSSRVSTDPSLILLWWTGDQLRIIVNRLKETETSSGRLNFCSQTPTTRLLQILKENGFYGSFVIVVVKNNAVLWILTTEKCWDEWVKAVQKRERNREKCVPVVSRVEIKFYGFSPY